MSVYSELGCKRVINAAFAYTSLGGSTLSKEVQAATDEANKSYCDMWDLIEKGSGIIAKGTGAEGACITSGGFAGLVVAPAACMAGKDPERIKRLPDSSNMKNEFIVQRNYRLILYDRALEVSGGKLVPVGDES